MKTKANSTLWSTELSKHERKHPILRSIQQQDLLPLIGRNSRSGRRSCLSAIPRMIYVCFVHCLFISSPFPSVYYLYSWQWSCRKERWRGAARLCGSGEANAWLTRLGVAAWSGGLRDQGARLLLLLIELKTSKLKLNPRKPTKKSIKRDQSNCTFTSRAMIYHSVFSIWAQSSLCILELICLRWCNCEEVIRSPKIFQVLF